MTDVHDPQRRRSRSKPSELLEDLYNYLVIFLLQLIDDKLLVSFDVSLTISNYISKVSVWTCLPILYLITMDYSKYKLPYL
jgi:hypothetical protein